MGINEKVQEWRAKSEAGTLTLAEMREAIQHLRQHRQVAVEEAKSKGRSKKVINSDQLLQELEGL